MAEAVEAVAHGWCAVGMNLVCKHCIPVSLPTPDEQHFTCHPLHSLITCGHTLLGGQWAILEVTMQPEISLEICCDSIERPRALASSLYTFSDLRFP